MTFGRKNGFTLIEFLIALVLIGLISTLLFAGIRLGGRSWEASEFKAEQMDEMRLVRDFIRRSIMQSRTVTAETSEGESLLFWGDEQMLEWVSQMPHQSGIGGLAIFRLSATETENGSQLVLDRWFYHPDIFEQRDDIPQWEPMVPVPVQEEKQLAADRFYGQHILMEGLKEFSISYFGDIEPDSEPEWLSEWLPGKKFPKLVKLDIHSPDSPWPEMVIALPDGSNIRAGGKVRSGKRK